MDKRDLVARTARQTGLTQTQAHEALDAILAAIAAVLADGDEVTLRDFGRFAVWHRQQTVTGFDGTRHQVDVPQVLFKASAVLRRRLYEAAPCADESA